MPARRRFLGLVGTTLAAGLSGCASSVPLLGGPPEIHERTPDAVDRDVPASMGEETPSPFATLVVGESGTQTHQVWVWNRTDDRRQIAVSVGPDESAEPWFARTYAFDAGSVLAIELRASRRYVIGVETVGREKTVDVPRSWFDCNDSATDVLVGEAETKVQTISTSMKCGDLW